MKRVAIALFVLFQLAAALVTAGPALAQAVPVTDLIEERAVAELGATLPAKAKLDIRMAEGMIKKGNFVQEFWIDPDSGQFIANVVTDSGVPQRVWGLAMVTLTVPVPNRRIVPDEIVRAQDVSLVEMPSVPSATLTPASISLRIGATPDESFMLESVLCTTEHLASPRSAISASVTQTP